MLLFGSAIVGTDGSRPQLEHLKIIRPSKKLKADIEALTKAVENSEINALILRINAEGGTIPPSKSSS